MRRSAPPQLETKLILADGLSGSGKSTVCQWLELQLQHDKIKARWLFEADVPHPLHWWDYWNGNQYCPPDFQRGTPSQFVETSIEKWKDFVAATNRSDEVCIAESALFRLGIGMLLQADAQPAELVDYGRRVHDIIKDLNPLLIYFRQTDVAVHLQKI
jgi:hypothetical protein